MRFLSFVILIFLAGLLVAAPSPSAHAAEEYGQNAKGVGKQENTAQTPTTTDAADRVDAIREKREAICKDITCSGHGVCVVKENNPVCACDSGFRPDARTRLHCIDEKIAPPAGATAPLIIPPPPMDPLSYEKSVRRAAKESMANNLDYQRYKRRMGFAIAGIVTGGISMAFGAMVGLLGLLIMEDDMTAAGFGILGGGTAIFIPSMVALKRNSRKKKKLYHDEIERIRSGRGRLSVGLSPFVLANTRGGGLNATFYF